MEDADPEWTDVHRLAARMRALLDDLPDVTVDMRYELDFYPYIEIDLLQVHDDAPPTRLATAYVAAARQEESHARFALRLATEALRLVDDCVKTRR